MKTDQRELHDYISETSEHADVQAGSPLPLEPRKREEELISPFSAVGPAASDWSCSIIPKTQRPPGQSISLHGATAPVTYGTFGCRGSAGSTLCLPRGRPLQTRRRTSFQFQPASSRSVRCRGFRGRPFGILHRHSDTTHWRRSKTWLSRSWIIPRSMPKCVFVNEPFEWGGDQPLGVAGRRPSFTKRIFAALPFTRSRARIIREPTAA